MSRPFLHRSKSFFYALLGLFLLLGLDSARSAESSGDSSGGTSTSGTGIFSGAPFQIVFSLRGGYDDNVATRSAIAQGSAFTNGALSVIYKFGDERTKINLEAGGGLTYYFEKISVNDVDPNGFLNLFATHKVSTRLSLQLVAYASYQQEPDFRLRLGSNRRTGNFFYTADKFTVFYLWTPRFSTATSYSLNVVNYYNSSSSFLNRFENTFGNEFRFLLWPTTTLLAEYRFGVVTYEQLRRDSIAHYTLAGFNHVFNPRLNVSFRGGAQFREYEDNTDQSSPYFEGTVNYALGKDTSVSWTNRYALEEPDALLNPSRTSFRTGLQARHNFTARIIGTLGAYYEYDEYQSVSMPVPISGFTEQSLDIAASVRYTINRHFAAEVGYNHTEIFSDLAGRQYSRNRFYGGVNVRF